MTPDDIMRMAREAGLAAILQPNDARLEHFAKLVAAYTLANIDPSKFMSYHEFRDK